ncbi:MAG: hypothetical protein IKQ17_12830 [Kiritimatiellae bacterium]|nr:hypothetical protein [Kiritimatiellia bacterium]
MRDAVQIFLLRFALSGLPVSLVVLAALWLWRVAAAEVRRRGIAKTLLFVALSAPVAFWAGGKGGRENVKSKDVDSSNQTIQTIKQSNNRLSSLHRYFAPTNFAAGADVFMRPTNAVTPSMWTRHNVSDDFQVSVPGWVAGICGVVTTQPWGIDSPETIEDGHTTLAPLYATNSFLLGTSDFWAVTNESSKTFVWKDLAFNRDPSNLVSFAATIYEWGDIEFTYGNVPDGGFSSFAKIGSETQDMTSLVAEGQTVRLEKNLEQDAEWWLENYPEICYTNETGELVFDYDTNEWYFVNFVVVDDTTPRQMTRKDFLAAIDEAERKLRAITNVNALVVERFLIGDTEDGVDPDFWDKAADMYMNKHPVDGYFGSGSIVLPSDTNLVYLGEENAAFTNCLEFFTINNIDILCDEIEKNGIDINLDSCEITDYGDTYFGDDEDGVRYVEDSEVDRYRGLYGNVALQVALRQKRMLKSSVKAAEKISLTVYVPPRTKITGQYVSNSKPRADECFTFISGDETNTVSQIPFRTGYIVHAKSSKRLGDTIEHGFGSSCECGFIPDTGNRQFYFYRSVSLKIEGVAFATASFATARAIMTPPVEIGSYSWESSSNINIVPIAGGRRAGLFLENGDAGFVKCVWDNGESGKWNLCATGEVSVVANPGYTNLTQFVVFRASPQVLVYEDAHLGTDGNPVPATSDLLSSLSCSYAGNRAGSLELSKVSGPDVSVSENGSPVSLPIQWEVAGGGNDPARNFSVGGLHAGDAAEFRLRFTSAAAPGGIDYYATVRAVGLEVVAQRTWPEERHRRVFGPHEPFLLRVAGGDPSGTWEYLNTNGTGNSFGWVTTQCPTNVAARLVIDGEAIYVPLSVIGPSACIGTNAVAMTDADWLEVTTNALAVGEVGAGLRIDLKLLPDYVSFEGLRTMEGFAPASDMHGYFTHVDMSAVNHDAQNGAGRVNVVQEGNLAGVDRAGAAYRVDELPQPWSDGSYAFNIPYYWWVDGSSQTNQFATNVQTVRLFASGDAEVSKFGWTAHRGTNGVQTVTREAQP